MSRPTLKNFQIGWIISRNQRRKKIMPQNSVLGWVTIDNPSRLSLTKLQTKYVDNANLPARRGLREPAKKH
jgi:hypothetical protein